MLCYCIGHHRCYDSLNDELLACNLAELCPTCELVAHKKHECLVAVEQHVVALASAQGYAQAVSIGIGSHSKVGTLLLGALDSHCHSLALLGVGRCNSWEVAIEHHLLLYTYNIVEAIVAQRLWNELHTSTVQWCVDDLHIVVLCYRLG